MGFPPLQSVSNILWFTGTFNFKHPTSFKCLICFDPYVLSGTSKNLTERSLLLTMTLGSGELSFEKDKPREWVSTTELLMEPFSRCLENCQMSLDVEEERNRFRRGGEEGDANEEGAADELWSEKWRSASCPPAA